MTHTHTQTVSNYSPNVEESSRIISFNCIYIHISGLKYSIDNLSLNILIVNLYIDSAHYQKFPHTHIYIMNILRSTIFLLKKVIKIVCSFEEVEFFKPWYTCITYNLDISKWLLSSNGGFHLIPKHLLRDD